MKGFVISWYFPPINSSEGLVTFKLLSNSKYTYDVFTQNSNTSWTYGKNESRLVSDNVTPIFVKTDDFKVWVKEGIEYFEQNKDKYDFIMSRSMAPESHEIALEIKRRHPDIKWIASFGDPISNNPYNYIYKPISPWTIKGKGFEYVSIRYALSPKRILKNCLWNYRRRRDLKKYDVEPYNIKLQSAVLAEADRIIFNNPYQMEYMLKDNSEYKDKSIVFPHTYDKNFYSNKKKSKHDKIVMSFIGHLDDIRTPRPLLNALVRLKENIPDIDKKLEINFYGNMSANDKLFLVDNYLLDFVHVKKPVTYFESLDIMQDSDWLLHVDANLGAYLNENIFFAAKIADYLGAGSNIFAITMDNGASADIMRETNSLMSSHSSDEVYNRLLEIINNKTDKLTTNNSHYDIKNVVDKYEKMVEGLIK